MPILSFKAGNNPFRISVVFPEPLTPVTQTNLPIGIEIEKFFRLF